MGKKCDLCKGVARMYCESDEASLCWDCDGKVHGANFLVAKHTRCLLCSVCQSLTPWNATGLRLFPTFSVCDSCFVSNNGGGGNRILSENRDHEEVNSFSSEEDRIREEFYDEDEEYSNDEEEEVDVDDDEEAENQVVPLSEPPPVMSSSSSDGGLVMKRTRDTSDLLCSDDEIGSSSVQESNYSPPLKRSSRGEPSFRSTAVVRLSEERTLNGPDTSSSSSLVYGISESRRDLSR